MPTDAINSNETIDAQDEEAMEFSAVNEEELQEEVASDDALERMCDDTQRQPLRGDPSELSPREAQAILPRFRENVVGLVRVS